MTTVTTLLTFKCSAFIKTIKFSEIGRIPSIGETLLFPEGAFKVINVISKVPSNNNTDIYIEQIV